GHLQRDPGGDVGGAAGAVEAPSAESQRPRAGQLGADGPSGGDAVDADVGGEVVGQRDAQPADRELGRDVERAAAARPVGGGRLRQHDVPAAAPQLGQGGADAVHGRPHVDREHLVEGVVEGVLGDGVEGPVEVEDADAVDEHVQAAVEVPAPAHRLVV